MKISVERVRTTIVWNTSDGKAVSGFGAVSGVGAVSWLGAVVSIEISENSSCA